MRKWVPYAIGGVILAVLVFRIIPLINKGSNGNMRQSGRPPVAVEAGQVTYGPIQEIRQFTGSVFPYNRYVVAPKVAGRIVQIRKRIGDWVKAGELIATIDDAEYQQDVREAEANLKIAEASLEEARSQLELARQEKERIESLASKGIATSAELDAAVTNYSAQGSRFELAKAQVEQRQASLKSSRIRLGYTRLNASTPGYIGERFVDEGALLAPNNAVVSVISIDTVIVRTTITEADYGHISESQQADVSVDAFPGRTFEGTVFRIAPMLQQESRVAQMEVLVVNDSTFLKPGMFARVAVMTAEKENTQRVPSRAVIKRNEQSGVFVIDEKSSLVHFVPVVTGIATPELTEILSPSLSGLVVTLGQHLLNEGSPVILPESDDTSGPDGQAEKTSTGSEKEGQGR